MIIIDGTCLCLSISRCIDAASLPGSCGTLRAATESQSIICRSARIRHLTALCSRKAVPPCGSRYRVIFRAAFVLACFASASPEALVLQTASQASSCIPALDVHKARPSGPPSVATTRPSQGLVSAAWFRLQPSAFSLPPPSSFFILHCAFPPFPFFIPHPS